MTVRSIRNLAGLFCGLLCLEALGQDSTYLYWFGHSLLSSGGVGRGVEFNAWRAERGKLLYQKMTNASADYSYNIQQSWNETHNKDSIGLGPHRDGVERWDYVIYNKLHNPLVPDTFYKYQGLYIDTIKASGAIPIIYDDWVYADGTRDVLHVCSTKAAYMVPIDTAYEWCLERYPDIHYKVDWAHAAEPLGYLAGSMCWASIYAEPTFGFSKVYAGLSAEEAHLMQQVAWNFITEPLFIQFQPWSVVPPLVRSIAFAPSPDTLEQYRTKQLYIRTTFTNDSADASSKWAIFRSLDPDIAVVSHSGVATGINLGVARITALRERSSDTLLLIVKPTTLVLDSIRISPRSFTSYLENGFQFQAAGYFRDGASPLTIPVTASVPWVSSDTSIFIIVDGRVQRKSALGGSMWAAVSLSGKTDTVRFTMVPELQYLARINFQPDSTVYNPVWTPDWGRAYSDAVGRGWEGIGSVFARIDDNAINYYDSNFLVLSFVSPQNAQAQGIFGTYHLKAPDGDYIIKACLGHFGNWGPMESRLVFLGDTLMRYTSVTYGRPKAFKDTIRVFGMDGIRLQIYGPIAYLVVCTQAGVDIDSIALDNGDFARKADPMESEALPGMRAISLFASPNPFKTVMTFSLNGARPSGELRVYDSRGRLAACVKPQGRTFTWNAKGLPSGLYVARYADETVRLEKKVILLK